MIGATGECDCNHNLPKQLSSVVGRANYRRRETLQVTEIFDSAHVLGPFEGTRIRQRIWLMQPCICRTESYS
jgi:hypothetical protein